MEYRKELDSITSKGFWRYVAFVFAKRGVMYGALVRWSYMSWEAALVSALEYLDGEACAAAL